jgi:hypothetical protein
MKGRQLRFQCLQGDDQLLLRRAQPKQVRHLPRGNELRLPQPCIAQLRQAPTTPGDEFRKLRGGELGHVNWSLINRCEWRSAEMPC